MDSRAGARLNCMQTMATCYTLLVMQLVMAGRT